MTDGAIEDAVLKMLDDRAFVMNSGAPLSDEWVVCVLMSEEVGYQIVVQENIFSKYAEKSATRTDIVKSLTAFVFELIEEDLCDIQVSSKMAS